MKSRKIKGLFLGIMIVCLSLLPSLGILGTSIYTSYDGMWTSYMHNDKKLMEEDFYRSNHFEFSTLRPIMYWLGNSTINEESSLEQEQYIEEHRYTTWDEEKQQDVELAPSKEEAIESLKSIKKDSVEQLTNIKNIKFIAVNTKDDTAYTNTQYKTIKEYEDNIDEYVDIKIIKNEDQGSYAKYINNKQSSNNTDSYFNLLDSTTRNNLDIRISLPKELKEGDFIFDNYKEYNKTLEELKFIATIIGGVFIVFIISFIIYKIIKVNTFEKENKFINILSKIPLEIWICIVSISGGFSVSMSMNSHWTQYSEYDGYHQVSTYFNYTYLILGFVCMIAFIILLYLLSRVIKSYERKYNILKNTIIYKVYKSIKGTIMKTIGLVKEIPLVKRILIVSGMWIFGVTIFMTFIYAMFMNATVFPFGMVISGGGIVYLLIKQISYLEEITKGAEKIKNGELNHKIEVKGNDYLTILAENINNIGQGLENSIDKQLRSERMKSELITNVSHDLKTPLTSIINYVELIKKEEDIQPEHIRDYVNVLDSKSKRLKVLIDDLFEASKASSGNIQLNMEKIDITQLLRQAIGEMEEKLYENNLDIKLRVPEEKIYIKADGKRLYRVLENLLSNIAKYSLTNTRVYIDVIKDENDVILTMKNISSYELNFDPAEIMERFKRADESRNTEGSGLGLSIARDLVNIQGGKFEIDIDGDLFKSVMSFNTID